MAAATFQQELQQLREQFDRLHPEFELTVQDDHSPAQGFVVVFNTRAAQNGPLGRCGKGGTRITPQVTLEEVRMLAKIMTLKNAAAGLPLGGAKSGIRADPAAPEFEQQYRRLARKIAPSLVEHGGPFGGFGFDIGGAPQHVRWICDELQSTRCFTGKPLELGGTDYDREGIAGYGVVCSIDQLLTEQGKALMGMRCAVQGLGAMGGAVVKYLAERGAEVVAVSDPKVGGTLLKEKTPPELWSALLQAAAAMSLDQFAQREQLKRLVVGDASAVLWTSCDIVFPCAVQGVVSEANVGRVAARYVVEGANNPLDAQARETLWRKGIPVVPDFIANPGGIIAAFVEMTSSVSIAENIATKAKAVQAKQLTSERIRSNVAEIMRVSAAHGVSLVDAGMHLALKRILAC